MPVVVVRAIKTMMLAERTLRAIRSEYFWEIWEGAGGTELVSGGKGGKVEKEAES